MSPTEQIRQFVKRTFDQLGVSHSTTVRETLLIRDGNYCGHRFAAEGFHAVWFAEEDQLKFYGSDGQLIQVQVPLTPHHSSGLAAA